MISMNLRVFRAYCNEYQQILATVYSEKFPDRCSMHTVEHVRLLLITLQSAWDVGHK